MSDSRVLVRPGEASKDGRCQACTVDSCPSEVWVILLGDPEGHRTEVRLCERHLTELWKASRAIWEGVLTAAEANERRSRVERWRKR